MDGLHLYPGCFLHDQGETGAGYTEYAQLQVCSMGEGSKPGRRRTGVPGIRRDIDIPIDGTLAQVKVERGDDMAVRLQLRLQLVEVPSREQHRRRVVDGTLVIVEIEFGRMDGHAAWLQHFH